MALALPSIAGESPTADIVVVSLRGDVSVTMRGAPRTVQAGASVELPATIRTGHDGAIDLRQGKTTVAIAADTELEIPATGDSGIDRLLQKRGNAFYDIAKREGRRLRVETPYLVAVIKGTQFNVAVQEDSSTISLFEGSLEVRATDDTDVVQLNAGEIAIRHATDKAIRVLRMDNGKPPATTSHESGTRSLTPGGNDGESGDPRVSPPLLVPGGLAVGSEPTIRVEAPDSDGSGEIGIHVKAANAAVSLDAGTLDLGAAGIDASADAAVDIGVVRADLGVDAAADLDAGAVNVATEAGAGLGVVDVDAGLDAALDVGAMSAETSAAAALDLGAASADLGADAAIDLDSGTADAAADMAANLGVASVDAALDVGADLGAGNVSTATDISADIGDATVDAGLETALDPAASVTTGVDASVAGVDVGVSVGADLGTGDLDLDVELGALDIGLGTDPAAETTPTGTPTPGPDPGGLLGGLLGGRRGN
jgi:hypothetical protein